MENALGLT
uniref:Uncharacterized protein n=1 Tax=Rhizophora mucronata TaxID=61149 RepID=A0A2P2QGI1_RHIMU